MVDFCQQSEAKKDNVIIPSQNSAIEKGPPALSKHIRLTIYSYLDYASTLSKISHLSKAERLALKDSAIAREGKSNKFKLGSLLGEACFAHDERLTFVMALCSYSIALCDSFEL